MVNLEKSKDSYGVIVKQKRLDVFNLSQEDFATKFNISVGTLRNWEQGINQPPPYFMQLLDKAEAEIHREYTTPICKIHDKLDNDSDNIRAAIRRSARKKINDDPMQCQIYNLIKDITKRDGILDNLQSIFSCSEDVTASDIAIMAQLILLKDISDKLDSIDRALDILR